MRVSLKEIICPIGANRVDRIVEVLNRKPQKYPLLYNWRTSNEQHRHLTFYEELLSNEVRLLVLFCCLCQQYTAMVSYYSWAGLDLLNSLSVVSAHTFASN